MNYWNHFLTNVKSYNLEDGELSLWGFKKSLVIIYLEDLEESFHSPHVTGIEYTYH